MSASPGRLRRGFRLSKFVGISQRMKKNISKFAEIDKLCQILRKISRNFRNCRNNTFSKVNNSFASPNAPGLRKARDREPGQLLEEVIGAVPGRAALRFAPVDPCGKGISNLAVSTFLFLTNTTICFSFPFFLSFGKMRAPRDTITIYNINFRMC